jgi:hypothetical protein
LFCSVSHFFIATCFSSVFPIMQFLIFLFVYSSSVSFIYYLIVFFCYLFICSSFPPTI